MERPSNVRDSMPSPSYVHSPSPHQIPHNGQTDPSSARRQVLQPRQPTVEDIAIPAISIRIRILPNSLIRPTTRNRARSSRAIPRQDQGTRGVESRAVARAGDPPIIGAVDHRVPRRLAVVGVDEILDPVDHRRLGEAVARGAVGVVFDVQHAGEGDAVAGPPAAVREEEVSLRGAGAGVRVGEVVTAADQAGGRCASVVRGEAGVNVRCAFGCLPRDLMSATGGRAGVR